MSPTVTAEAARAEATTLLAWYDRHRRRLPWRALPGETAEPYRVWLSEIMLQQTTTAAAGPYFLKFLERFPTVRALADAPLDEVLRLWAGLGYYARARNLHACAKTVAGLHGGNFPDTEDGLRDMPGIGPYTAAAIAAIAFDRSATVVDGNVERVVARLFAVEDEMPRAKPQLRRLAATLTPDERPGDFAQAVMDLGATICTPRRPACALCPWTEPCTARALGLQETFPRKAAKTERPTRFGAAFVARRADGAVLLRRRPERGLLGAMVEVPGSDWSETPPSGIAGLAPVPAGWIKLGGGVRHVFSHFALELDVYRAEVAADTLAPEGCWWSLEVADEALPGVMRKVVAHALG
jgi:A/G-specific adenine glycosylase